MGKVIIDSLEQARHLADSLRLAARQQEIADSLQLVRQREIADSLHLQHLQEIERATNHIFGDGSILCAQKVSILADNLSPLNSDMIYNVFAIAALFLYIIWLPKIVGGGAVKWSRLKHIGSVDEQSEVVTKQKITLSSLSWIVGVTMVVALFIKMLSHYLNLSVDWEFSSILLSVYALVVVLMMFGAMLLHTVSYITLSSQFVSELFAIRRRVFVIATLFISPTVILLLLSKEDQTTNVVYLLVLECIIVLLIFLFQTFLLFLRKNISILHWILYLCAVELFPITLVWGVISRLGLIS